MVIDQIDLPLLQIACPEGKSQDLILWVEPLKAACRRFNIDEIREVAAFLSQIGHESQGLTRLEESLYYTTPERLHKIFRKYFPTVDSARPYVRNPQRVANKVYANRMGNGPESSGDGWTFRGAGPIQLTGRRNQSLFANFIGVPVSKVGDYLRTREGGALGAGWFWDENNLNRYAMTPGVEDETRRINGGYHGLDDRRSRFNAVVRELLDRGC